MLSLDPSGNFGAKEGNGTTGWSLFKDGELQVFGHVKAEEFPCPEAYWHKVVQAMLVTEPQVVVCESYKLFGHKAMQQSGSTLDTPQLIGILRYELWKRDIKLVFQDPKDKVRVTDAILVHMGVLEQTAGGRYQAMGRQTVIHERDAIRHGVFYHRYGVKKK